MNRLYKKWSNMHAAGKASIVFFLSSFIIKGIAFIVTPIFTRIMTSDQYGLVATYGSWTSIIEVFALLGLTSAGVFNVGLNDHKEDRNQFISTIIILCNITTCIAFGAIFLIKRTYGDIFQLPDIFWVYMFLQMFFGPSQVFWITRQRYEYKYVLPFIVTIVSNIIAQSVAIFAILGLPEFSQATVRISANTLVLLVFQIPIYIMLLVKGERIVDLRIWKTTLLFAIPLIPHYLAQHVMASSDRIMISQLSSTTGVAIYSVVVNISMISTIIWNAINGSLIPYTYEKISDNKGKEVNKIVLPILLGYALMCVGVTLIAPEVLRILAPKEYYSGIYAVPPIAATAFISALYNIYANIEFLHKKSWWISIATIASAIVNIGLNYLFIPKYGYIAAAYTTLISNAVLILMHYMGYRLFHKERIYNDTGILIISISAIVICELCNLLYTNNLVRYFVLISIFVIVVTNRKYIIAQYKLLSRK